jgi:hypothetical protein
MRSVKRTTSSAARAAGVTMHSVSHSYNTIHFTYSITYTVSRVRLVGCCVTLSTLGIVVKYRYTIASSEQAIATEKSTLH